MGKIPDQRWRIVQMTRLITCHQQRAGGAGLIMGEIKADGWAIFMLFRCILDNANSGVASQIFRLHRSTWEPLVKAM
jgi:hypothetical protein